MLSIYQGSVMFRTQTEEWCSCIGDIVKNNSEACVWFINFLAGERGKGYVRYGFRVILQHMLWV